MSGTVVACRVAAAFGDGLPPSSPGVFEPLARVKLFATKASGLYGGGGRVQVEVDEWCAWFDREVGHASAPMLAPHTEGAAVDKKAAKAAESVVKASLEALERALGAKGVGEGGWLVGGGGPSLADVVGGCCVAPLLSTGVVIGLGLGADKIPNVTRWARRCLDLPQFKAVLGDVVFAKMAPGNAVQAKEGKGAAAKDGAMAAHPNEGKGIEAKAAQPKAGIGGKGGSDEVKGSGNRPEAGGSAEAEKAAHAARRKAENEAKKEAKRLKLAEKAVKLMQQEAAKTAERGGKEKKAKGSTLVKIDYVNITPPGEFKRDLAEREVEASYNPPSVEAAWYDWWDKCGMFKPEAPSSKPPYVIVIPPPNVTGSLHLGHALTNSLQDTLVRWRRMQGYNALWVPGTDHAGIATQVVVEKKIKRDEGKTRHDLGREAFVSKVWEWKEEYGSTIYRQLKRLGSSLDWTREAFTMDSNLSAAVQESFVRLYDDGVIYRGTRLVNWSVSLKSAISDLEVDYMDLAGPTQLPVPGHDPKKKYAFGVLTKFAYKVVGSDTDELVIATTRPETMLGDTAVAVHPDDSRYKHLHGKMLRHPFVERVFPVICDPVLVDMNFGTGAVKITPAHDPNDFESGKRHGLPMVNILTEDGLINDNGGPLFVGMKRYDARDKVVELLKEHGLYRGEEPNPGMRVPICSRSKDVIEPYLVPQWYVNCKDMAAGAVDAVRNGDLDIQPKAFETTWYRWLEDCRDWCISRQLWWGHRIPAYYARLNSDSAERDEEPERWVVARTFEEAEKKAHAKWGAANVKSLEQDPDVLDTWYSSGLFPFSVFGWPNETLDLKTFYPTSLLETGHDILFFWVARMVMMGMKLTGKVPFKTVYLHAMVRDAHGRKMSKSLGNVIDPLQCMEGATLDELGKVLESGNLDPTELKKAKQGQKKDFPSGIAECGADALRFALVNYTGQARDINLDVNRVVGYRMFCNKMWNACKFMNWEGFNADALPGNLVKLSAAFPARDSLPVPCQWILSRLHSCCVAVNRGLETYDFPTATQSAYVFWLNELCDVFLEMIKPTMKDGSESDKILTQATYWVCLEHGLRILHPVMPFVTEELWQRLPWTAAQLANRPKSIMLAEYPEGAPALSDPILEDSFKDVMEAVRSIRSMKASYSLTNKQRPDVILAAAPGSDVRRYCERLTVEVASVSYCGNVNVVDTGAQIPPGCGSAVVSPSLSVNVVLKGIIDVQAEIAKLEKKMNDAVAKVESIDRAAGSSGYDKVPAEVRWKHATNRVSLQQEQELMAKLMEDLKSMEI